VGAFKTICRTAAYRRVEGRLVSWEDGYRLFCMRGFDP
jgi:hypothetical protein